MEREARDIPIDLRDPELSEKARKRLSVLLDMNVWIDLAEGKAQQASRLREKVQQLVKRGKLFCPLAPTIIWELYRQSYTSAVKVAELMEELSLGIAFAPTEEIYLHEVDAVFEAIQSGRQPRVVGPAQLFVPIIAHISSVAHIHFPNVTAFEDPQQLTDEIVRQLLKMGFVEFCKMTHARLSQLEVPAPGFAATGVRRREIAGRSREKARRVEEQEVMSSIVTPRLTELRHRLPWNLQCEFYERLTKLPTDRYGGVTRHLLASMPSIDRRVDVFSLIGEDPTRRDRINDFFDLELIMAPYVYSTVLVTRDKWIRHLLKDLGGDLRCLWTYEALEEFLDELEKQAA
jgi:hypothetical protein